MNWLTNLAFAVLLLSVQYVAAKSSSNSLSRSPWADPDKANSLMTCLITRIASSNVLPQQEKEDLESIMGTLMSAINGANAKSKSSGAQLQAINMAVASSLAEIVVAEDVGNQENMAVKTQALSVAIEQCFQEVMGTVDRRFISEINDLISMFARQAASDAIEDQDEESVYEEDSSATSSFDSTSQSAETTYQSNQEYQESSQRVGEFGGIYPLNGGASTTGLLGPVGVSPLTGVPLVDNLVGAGPQAGLIARVANTLANSSIFRGVLRSGVPQNTLSNVVQRTVQSLANTLGVDGNNLARIALQAISQVPAGSDTNAYATAFSTALVNGGILNERNIDSLGSRVLSGILNGVTAAAQALGLNVDLGGLQNDIRSNVGSLTTSSSSTSFSETATSATNGATLTTGLLGPGGVGPLSGVPLVDNLVGGRAQAGLIPRVANALANSPIFRGVLRSGVPQNTLSNVVQRTVQSLANTLGVDGNNLSRIALQAISQVPAGSDTNVYATAFSTALVNGGILNERNIDSLGSRVLSAVLNGVTAAAQALGLNTDLGGLQNDIRSTVGSVTSSSSSTSLSETATSSTSGVASSTRPLGVLPAVSQAVDNLVDGNAPNELSLISTLNSPIGLKSGSASTRIRQMTSSLLSAVRRNGVDANALARSLRSSFASLTNSGMSPSDAKIEVLLETIVGLLQILSNAQIRGIDTASLKSLTSSAARSFELALA